MPVSSPESGDFAIARTSAEVAIRVGLLLVLVYWCFSIAEPFLVPIVWGMVIAVAVIPRLRPGCGTGWASAAASPRPWS